MCTYERYPKKSSFFSTQYSSIPTFHYPIELACGTTGNRYPDPEDQVFIGRVNGCGNAPADCSYPLTSGDNVGPLINGMSNDCNSPSGDLCRDRRLFSVHLGSKKLWLDIHNPQLYGKMDQL